VPLLGDIPVLGALFRQNDKTDNKNELLIFVTPKILKDSINLR
jgi:type IV pilus assembly protein PilQ